jgi:hypothetical protein
VAAPVAHAPIGQYGAGQYAAGPTVHGRVTGANGAGLTGAVITLTAPSGVQAGRAVSDRDGSYAVALPTGGTYLLVAASGALQPHAVMVPVAEGAVRHDVLLSGTSHLAGTVLLPDPRFGPVPAEAVTVTLIDARGDVAGSARTDVEGRYRIDGVAAGWYTLTASGEGHQPVASAVELLDGLTTERDLELPRRARLEGTVRAGGTGRTVPDAVATLVDERGQVVGSSVTGPDGTFGFDDLPRGTYTLTASGYAPDVQVVQVPAGGTASVRVALGPATGPSNPGPGAVREPATGPLRIPVAGS